MSDGPLLSLSILLFGGASTRHGYLLNSRSELMKTPWIVLLVAGLMAACNSEGLSPERKACLGNAKTEAERIACNNAAAIREDREED